MLKGFIIFLTATFEPVRLSLAELCEWQVLAICLRRGGCFTPQLKISSPGWVKNGRNNHTKRDQMRPCPQAANQNTYVTKLSVLQVAKGVVDNLLLSCSTSLSPAYLEVISKVVPKIWALTNSAILNYVISLENG